MSRVVDQIKFFWKSRQPIQGHNKGRLRTRSEVPPIPPLECWLLVESYKNIPWKLQKPLLSSTMFASTV